MLCHVYFFDYYTNTLEDLFEGRAWAVRFSYFFSEVDSYYISYWQYLDAAPLNFHVGACNKSETFSFWVWF